MQLDDTLLSVYKTAKKADMYLYTRKRAAFDELPEGLRAVFGTPIHVMDVLLTKNKQLARVEREELIKQIKLHGFYLQMPEAKEDYMLDLYVDTSDRYKDML